MLQDRQAEKQLIGSFIINSHWFIIQASKQLCMTLYLCPMIHQEIIVLLEDTLVKQFEHFTVTLYFL